MFRAIYTLRFDGDYELLVIINVEHEYGEQFYDRMVTNLQSEVTDHKVITMSDFEVGPASIING